MAIVKMRKLHLIAMSYDKDAILNALQRTNAAEVVVHTDTEHTLPVAVDDEETRGYLASVEAALHFLCLAVENRLKERGESTELLKDGFDVTYSQFVAAGEQKEEMDVWVQKINALADERNLLKAELAKTTRNRKSAEIYAVLTQPFGVYKGSAHTYARIGVIPISAKENLLNDICALELCACEVLNITANEALLYVVGHKSISNEMDSVLSTYGFTDAPYQNEENGAEIYKSLAEKEKALSLVISKNEDAMYELKEIIRPLKIYCEYLSFTLEKEHTAEKLRATEYTFLLQAYVPAPSEEEVQREIKQVTSTVFMEFSDPTDEDEPPTLLQNNALVSNFEGITNTYSPPNYREFDPNGVMALFYSLFMGFIIGDAGYGLLMFLCGGFLWWKGRARPTGMSKLAGAFALGGVFAVVWGLLFNSLFGIAILPKTLLPNPQTDMWSLAGISVPSVLIISMEIGVVQIIVGYLCKAIQEWRRGNILDGICDGGLWVLFSIGVGLAIVGFVEEANIPMLGTVGAVMAGGSLLLAMLTAGRHEKFFGKFRSFLLNLRDDPI